MSHGENRIEETLAGFHALLDALGVSIVDGVVVAPFDSGPNAGTIEIAAVGWATVELDRAEAELGANLGANPGAHPGAHVLAHLGVDLGGDLSPEHERTFEPTARDALLGASARRSINTKPPILLLEPDTEGRLSGALAKHGEGLVALYLRTARLDQLPATLSIRAGNGPLGPARLVLSGPPWGPFLILVGQRATTDADRVPSKP